MEKVIEIIRDAIRRMPGNLRERVEKDDIIPYLEEVMKEDISNEAKYYIIMGIAYEYLIPLTPRDVRKIRELLLKW